ncbi:hypothetical protein Tsubulata_032011 [Turnera subulata]|uniref:t-SNARE coiled-coil homology domain-containing protein n=1 Tax=Turnera subulata TaxID=218843 RepID=A0A9Q0JGJ2_9ROSI|nr:hypothetical protein Tsubulata_032011 [Turnera subulata]
MSVIDILFRVDDICKRYEKYDIEKQRELNAYGDDTFAHQYAAVEAEIESALNKADVVAMETNRASVAAKNAEIRRIKARLMDEVPKLAKLAKKKVKGLSKEEHLIRADWVLSLPDRIQAIPDGTTRADDKGGWAGSASNNIKFDTSDAHLNDEFFQESEESSAFRQEHERRKLKQAFYNQYFLIYFSTSSFPQDEGLDVISEGLDVLKNLAQDMSEELDRQVPLIDEIETKVDKATSDLRNTNVRLKKTLVEIRSSRNFCIDIILLCVILGIASYLYNILN